MSEHLFNEFEKVSSKEWKNQIQYELKGADYNETLIWESLEGIKVKPFYHADSDHLSLPIQTSVTQFSILQHIFVKNVEKSIYTIQNSLTRGAESLRLTIADDTIDIQQLLAGIKAEKLVLYIELPFFSESFIKKINEEASKSSFEIFVVVDPIHQLAHEGNWFKDLNTDFSLLNTSISHYKNINLVSVNAQLYQNAGANITQQLAYTMAHLNEYLNRIPNYVGTILIKTAVGTNYFFEIAKLRALRLLTDLLTKEYHKDIKIHIQATPTRRNKTLYDYNVNMLRTTTECMSAIIGGADAVENMSYDALYHKTNEFGDRISRNQLLILKNESYFDKVNNPADGAYYIESLTAQLAEKALVLFKDIEKNGGFITQLIEGTIQRKINESAEKEQELFNTGKEVLLGTNKFPNPNDRMAHDLELYPFVKKNARKTLIKPIIEKRLAENIEEKRLEEEKNPTVK